MPIQDKADGVADSILSEIVSYTKLVIFLWKKLRNDRKV